MTSRTEPPVLSHRATLRVCVRVLGCLRNFAWVALLKDGSISIGFVDHGFTMTGFSTNDDQGIAPIFVELSKKYPPGALANPHFTFHRPQHLMQLGVTGQKEKIWQGLTWAGERSPPRERMPWVRFTSNPVKDLELLTRSPSGKPNAVLILDAPSDDISVQLAADFITDAEKLKSANDPKRDRLITWHAVNLHLFAFPVPGQQAVLQWHLP